MIQGTNITKIYPSGYRALQNVNFTIRAKEMVFLTGHSGAGKTTLLKLMMRAQAPTSGQMLINKRNISQLPAKHIPFLRRYIGIVFQDPNLLNHRTVYDNVALPLRASGFRAPEIKKRVHAALDKVGLLSREKNTTENLSSGEQQRVGIARAVVNSPKVLLADEPTGNLDPVTSLKIMKLFEAFNEIGTTVVIVSHDISLISTLPYRRITLKDGQIIKGDSNG